MGSLQDGTHFGLIPSSLENHPYNAIMYVFHSVLLVFVLSGCALTARAQGTTSFDLQTYRWENRLLVVFAEHKATPAYQALLEEIEWLHAEFEDRDMVLISLLESGQSTAGKHRISPKDVEVLRSRFRIKPGSYRVLLIGKDGGVKREGGDEIRPQELFELIDTMPMRKSEMRRKANQP